MVGAANSKSKKGELMSQDNVLGSADVLSRSPSDTHSALESHSVEKVIRAALIGNIIEWYDYLLYGFAAALVFSKVFFPTLDGTVGMIASLGTFAVGSIARPIGAIILGHLGDRYGRRKILLATVIMISTSTALIGLLPTYDQIGIWAPAALVFLRVIQGVSVAGEWAGAAVMVIESAPQDKRTRWGAVLQVGGPLGTLIGAALLALMSLLPPEQFLAWGWRVPFLSSFLLLIISVWLRWGLEETPEFKRLEAKQQTARVPLVKVLAEAPFRIAIAICATLCTVAGVYVINTFMISYGTTKLGLSSTVMLTAVYTSNIVEMIVLFLIARWFHRLSPATLNVIGSVLSLAAAAPIFWLVETKNPVLVVAAISIGMATVAFSYAAIAHLLPSLFPTSTRYSAVAVSYNLTGVIGSFMPVIAATVFAASGSSTGLILLFAGIAATSLFGSIAALILTQRHAYA